LGVNVTIWSSGSRDRAVLQEVGSVGCQCICRCARVGASAARG